MKLSRIFSRADDFDIVVIGAGGNGSHFLKAFADFDMFNRYAGYMNFRVHVHDDDFIEAHNTSRQAFNPASVGFNKAVNICSRINTTYGLDYKAYADRVSPLPQTTGLTTTIYVLAVDSPSFRHDFYTNNPHEFIIDMGNGDDFGQVWFVYDQAVRKTDAFKQYMKSLAKAAKSKDNSVSCSHLDSVKSQGLFVNNSMANIAATWMFNLFMYNPLLLNYVTYYNASSMKMNSLSMNVSYDSPCESPLINRI